jgi:hypothetical protein
LEEGALEGVVVGQRINWRLVMTRTLSGSGFSLLLLGCHPLFLLFTSFHSGQNRAFLSPITINNKPTKAKSQILRLQIGTDNIYIKRNQ